MRSRSLAEVVGGNCRRIRTEIGITQDELSLYARAHGLKWNAAKAGDFEAGRSEPTLATVLKVGMALQQALAFAQVAAGAIKDRTIPADRTVTLADLLGGNDGLVALADDLAVTTADLANVARGESFPSPRRDKLQRSGLAEQRLAKALGIDDSRLADVSQRLWGNTVSEERDKRAGAGANQQKKARVSRELRAEIEKAIADGND
jgi:transcriptional regulator with XRE-family HTH domain